MKDIILKTQERIATITDIKHIDQDWGQLADFGVNIPIKWPCCLIDISEASYSNIGKDISKKPQNRQMSSLRVVFTIANLQTTNTGYKAPKTQKDNALKIWD